MSADANFASLSLELPPAPKPMGVYKPIVVIGNLAYLSGHGPLKTDGSLTTGRVGVDLDQAAGFEFRRRKVIVKVITSSRLLRSERFHFFRLIGHRVFRLASPRKLGTLSRSLTKGHINGCFAYASS